MKREYSSKIKILYFGISFLFAFIIYGGITFNVGLVSVSKDFEGNPLETAGAYPPETNQITIDGDSGWITINSSKPWCSGHGTFVDPYVIEDITFNVSYSLSGLSIENSDKYFIIINCTFMESTYGYKEDGNPISFRAGIKLTNVTNGIIQNNTLVDNTIGIFSDADCRNITIIENNLYNNSAQAIYLMGGNFTLTDNTMINSGIKIPAETTLLSTYFTSKTHVIDTSNTLDENPVYYLVNESGLTSAIFGMDTPGQVIAVNVSNSVFSGLDMAGGSLAFQFLFSANNTIINSDFNNVVNRTLAAGIFIQGCINTTITGNRINNCTHGIRVKYSFLTSIIGNNFTDNHWGIYGGKTPDVDTNQTIENNQFINNTIAGIFLSEATDYIIKVNEINITSEAGIAGIHLSSSSNCQIIGNTLDYEGNISDGSSGISLYESIDNNISGNNIHKYYHGIKINKDSTNNIISSNNIMNTSFYGIKIDDLSTDVNITDNTLEYNGQYSIYCEDSDTLSISFNNASNNDHTGIYITGCDDTDILNNTITQNLEYGIYLDQSANCKINYNTLSNNTICIGVHQNTCPNLEVIGNTCTVTQLDTSDDGGGSPPLIPGYVLLLIIGITGLVSIFLLKKRKSQIKLNSTI